MSEIIFRENVVEISLTKGKVALVDVDVFLSNALFGFPWCSQETKCGFYAYRKLYFGDGTRPTQGVKIYMHRLVMKAPDGYEVDHRNGNGLDNRKDNLRLCIHAQNVNNRAANKGRQFKGVFFRGTHWRRKRWMAAIRIGPKNIILGYFLTPEEAALAYDNAAIHFFGEFARLNGAGGEANPLAT